MDHLDSDFLSTGEVARLCGVSRDAVLKWIKKGKLPSTRTPGGHHRVPRSACEELAVKESEPEVAGAGEHVPGGKEEDVRCWEYFGESGAPRDACRSCLVYLARAQNCYRLAELGEDAGHRMHFCRNECRTCAYYRACQGLAAEVLLISQDEALAKRIQNQADPRKISVRWARSGYEASRIVSTFTPSLVILDSDLPQVRSGFLTASVGEDDRIPGARIVVACRRGDEGAFRDQAVRVIPAPFNARDVESLARGVAGTSGRVPRGAA